MSRIYFHSKDNLAELAGAERHFMSHVIGNIAVAAVSHLLDEWRESKSVFRSVVPSWAQSSEGDFEKAFRLVSQRGEMGGHNVFALQMNTVMRTGNDVLKLMCRLHGQCEVHAYVEGPNRAWLAGLIERGMKSHLFRTGAGWESVVALLREDNTTAVVTSFSVTDWFPHYEEQSWDEAMEELRIGPHGKGLEMKPENWEDYWFDDGVTLLDLGHRLKEEQREGKPRVTIEFGGKTYG